MTGVLTPVSLRCPYEDCFRVFAAGLSEMRSAQLCGEDVLTLILEDDIECPGCNRTINSHPELQPGS